MDPKELNFQLAHLGINQADAAEGAATAALLSSLFGWEQRDTPGSIFVNEQFEGVGCSVKVQTQIDIAVDEIFGNIVHYAYGENGGEVTVRIEMEDNPQAAVITFIDSGVPYDPLSQAEPDITLSADERKIGGLGIFMVKKTMDDLAYEHKNGMNILKIRKNFS